MPTVQVSDIQIHYEEYGEGRPLIMILGLGQDTATWGFQVPELSKYFRLIVFDNRDSGKSSGCEGEYTTVTMARDTLGLMDQLNIPRATILGTSMGGMIAQHVALLAPERIISLILASTTASGGDWINAFYGSWKEHMNSEDKSTGGPAVMPWLFSKPFRQKQADKVKEIKERFTSQYIPRNSPAFQKQMQANTTHDTRDCLKLIKAPTLIMVGEDDELTPPRMAEELKSLIPKAELLVYKQGGHGLYWEIPQLFNEAVIEFTGAHL